MNFGILSESIIVLFAVSMGVVVTSADSESSTRLEVGTM